MRIGREPRLAGAIGVHHVDVVVALVAVARKGNLRPRPATRAAAAGVGDIESRTPGVVDAIRRGDWRDAIAKHARHRARTSREIVNLLEQCRLASL